MSFFSHIIITKLSSVLLVVLFLKAIQTKCTSELWRRTCASENTLPLLFTSEMCLWDNALLLYCLYSLYLWMGGRVIATLTKSRADKGAAELVEKCQAPKTRHAFLTANGYFLGPLFLFSQQSVENLLPSEQTSYQSARLCLSRRRMPHTLICKACDSCLHVRHPAFDLLTHVVWIRCGPTVSKALFFPSPYLQKHWHEKNPMSQLLFECAWMGSSSCQSNMTL